MQSLLGLVLVAQYSKLGIAQILLGSPSIQRIRIYEVFLIVVFEKQVLLI